MSREKADSSTFFFFFISCVFKSYTLSTLIRFIAFLLGMLLFLFSYLFIFYSFLCLCLYQSMWKTSVETCLLACVGGFTVCCAVEVTAGSRMLQPPGGDGGVGGVGWILSAAGLLSQTLEQLQTRYRQEQLARMSGSGAEDGGGGG